MRRKIGVGLIVAAFVLLSLQRCMAPAHQQATPPVIVPQHITPAQSWEQEKANRETVRNALAQMQAQTDRMYNVQPPPQGIEAMKQERDQMHRTQEVHPQQPVQALAQQEAGQNSENYLTLITILLTIAATGGVIVAVKRQKDKDKIQGGKKS